MEASSSESVKLRNGLGNGQQNIISLERKHEPDTDPDVVTLQADINYFSVLDPSQEPSKDSLQTADFSNENNEYDPFDELISYSLESEEESIVDMMDSSVNYISRDTFIQRENCFGTAHDSDALPHCCECEKDPMTNKYSCRFFEFRKIERDNGMLKAIGFLDPYIDPNILDLSLWNDYEERLIIDRKTADYILGCVASQFCEMSERELKVRKNQSNVAWKRSVLQVREVCDVCETSLFNYHWTCKHCGTIVCIDCFEERKAGTIRWKPKTKADKEERDSFFWLKCQKRGEHDLLLTQITTGDALLILNKNIHKLCDYRNVTQNCGCSLRTKNCLRVQSKKVLQDREQEISQQELRKEIKLQRYKAKHASSYRLGVLEMKQIGQIVQFAYVSQGKVVKVLEPSESEDCYRLFQDQWEKGKPIVVANTTRNIRKYSWSPEYFSSRFGNEKHVMIDCQNGNAINRVAMKFFWDGFGSFRKRLPRDCEQKCVLKLKDWPTSDDFSNVMKDHFEDIMKSVPLADYTNRNGKLNLVRYLPEYFSRPDLGPKMYSAYSQAHPSTQGSTNLHLDVSDAVNVMVHTSKPTDAHLAPKQYSINSLREVLATAGADEIDIINLMNGKKLPGAIWHIFPANKADDIRNLLQTVARENKKPLGVNDDPIHDQNWYIDQNLRKRLQASGVESYTIVQYEGDAVFIPAGAPHQVLNLFDCIKVALDFVAPENLSECINLTEEFRILSTRHQNREDKLQIKNILYHTVKNIVPSEAVVQSDPTI